MILKNAVMFCSFDGLFLKRFSIFYHLSELGGFFKLVILLSLMMNYCIKAGFGGCYFTR